MQSINQSINQWKRVLWSFICLSTALCVRRPTNNIACLFRPVRSVQAGQRLEYRTGWNGCVRATTMECEEREGGVLFVPGCVCKNDGSFFVVTGRAMNQNLIECHDPLQNFLALKSELFCVLARRINCFCSPKKATVVPGEKKEGKTKQNKTKHPETYRYQYQCQ